MKAVSKAHRHQPVKSLHPDNLHRFGYDYPALVEDYPPLQPFLQRNITGALSISYADPLAVKALNTALLKHHYQINDWDIPEGALCPAVPGRADYLHHMASLLPNQSDTRPVRILDIGTGASGIYLLLASQIFGWHGVGTDINTASLTHLQQILNRNPELKAPIELRHQPNKHHIFEGIIQPDEFFDITVCNPPFHSSLEEARKSNYRKRKNLGLQHQTLNPLNFGGQGAELWCNGGEPLFLKKIAKESAQFAQQCLWFSSLISRQDNVRPMQKQLRKLAATQIKVIEMQQGQKLTRIIAWTFQSVAETAPVIPKLS
ncbi:23S rRNA (adenine(1618)-N(6))-methyltransferase RlmF [Celerinatantimonas sp. YJH-8]|uniref:23S rRNA (adenine(1618)-N(6))-methyltransferase RlmF n=1 Tax=Celerinatantimonas sp. YJH-8 TaxID=3228714 RepID=UPI0038BF13B9